MIHKYLYIQCAQEAIALFGTVISSCGSRATLSSNRKATVKYTLYFWNCVHEEKEVRRKKTQKEKEKKELRKIKEVNKPKEKVLKGRKKERQWKMIQK